MDPQMILVLAAIVVVMLGWHEHKKLVLVLGVMLVGSVAWLDGVAVKPVPQKKWQARKVYSMLVSIDLEDQARKLYSGGLDTLEKVSTATPAAAYSVGIKPVHWRHIYEAARRALDLPEAAAVESNLTPPPATPMPVPTLPPGTRHHVLQPDGASQDHINDILKADGGAGPSKPLLSVKIPGAAAKPTPSGNPEGKPSPPFTHKAVIDDKPQSLDDLVEEVTKKKVLKSLKAPQQATPPPPPTPPPMKTGLIVLLEAATPGPDSFSCTFDSAYGELGAEVGESANVRRFESVKEAEAAGGYTLLVKDPVMRMAGVLKRYPPDCLYPDAMGGQPRRNPLETFAGATQEQRDGCEEMNNRLTKILSQQPFDTPISKVHYEEALKVLSSTKRILVLENIESSMEMLQKAQTEIRTYVTCAPHMQTPRKSLPEEVVTALEEANKYDLQLYLHAARMFEAEVNKGRPTFSAASEAPCETDYTPVCWDGTQPFTETRKVEKDNMPELLTCQGDNCKATRGRDVTCSVKRCKLREPKEKPVSR